MIDELLVIVLIIIVVVIVFVYLFTKDHFTMLKKSKVLIISCYGYGNIGDNMYNDVFKHYLSDYEIRNIPDHDIFVDEFGNFHKTPPAKDYQFDYLIIGGGGLIISTKLRNSHNMMHYITLAKQRNKPLFIISCGVQGSVDNFEYDFRDWKPVFDQAALITVRSPKDQELISRVTNSQKVHYFRDLGYLRPHLNGRAHKSSNPQYITLIVAGPVHDKNPQVQKFLEKYNDKNTTLVIMNMGSLKDDDNNTRIKQMNFPNYRTLKYYGSGKASEFANIAMTPVNQETMEKILTVDPKLRDHNPSDLTIDTVLDIIKKSKIVLTGRYHGCIFARSLGVPWDTLGMDTNKIMWEPPESKDISIDITNAYNHIKLLRKIMNHSS